MARLARRRALRSCKVGPGFRRFSFLSSLVGLWWEGSAVLRDARRGRADAGPSALLPPPSSSPEHRGAAFKILNSDGPDANGKKRCQSRGHRSSVIVRWSSFVDVVSCRCRCFRNPLRRRPLVARRLAALMRIDFAVAHGAHFPRAGRATRRFPRRRFLAAAAISTPGAFDLRAAPLPCCPFRAVADRRLARFDAAARKD